MDTLEIYKSFNSDKSIEELQYNILKESTNLDNLKFELQFYKLLLNKSIYKPHALNLYERLTGFKNEITSINKKGMSLLNELNTQAHQIRNKIECDDMACDNFFIKNHDNIELKVFNFKTQVFNFKFRLFQYLQSVIIN
ncbi:hypothetical protein [Thalassobellus suaedae]|uniref:Uncharacterized protein n=1 Tax=Thalassobellus suaedae TaxID=3074124 RepID=A0ABY9Y450_9FLAO|nr:hypothetical protein RHP51_08425 [Flavobacteriaceae bacterium HL-DH14]WNH12653.1 hypothetical protein RHP49_17415 [Flavobacteriaceae bacterium HL-DH10]